MGVGEKFESGLLIGFVIYFFRLSLFFVMQTYYCFMFFVFKFSLVLPIEEKHSDFANQNNFTIKW